MKVNKAMYPTMTMVDDLLASQWKTKKVVPRKRSIKDRTWTTKTQKALLPNDLEGRDPKNRPPKY